MRTVPAIDMHAHVDASISSDDLLGLGAVFVATRSLDEADAATRRHDARTAWGVGCHPGLARAHRSFAVQRFAELIARTAYVSEVGLDRTSRVPLEQQVKTFDSVLDVLQRSARITSIHSYEAADAVLRAL